MKIIAITAKDQGYQNGRYLIEAGDNEIRRILGDRPAKCEIYIGQEIPVAALYDRVKCMRDGEVLMKSTAENLRALATMMEQQLPGMLPEKAAP